jgi:hypothetical protein
MDAMAEITMEAIEGACSHVVLGEDGAPTNMVMGPGRPTWPKRGPLSQGTSKSRDTGARPGPTERSSWSASHTEIIKRIITRIPWI